MPHCAAFHLGLRCLPKYPFRVFQAEYKGLIIIFLLKKMHKNDVTYYYNHKLIVFFFNNAQWKLRLRD